MWEQFKRDWRGIILQAVAFAITLVFFLIVTTVITGGFTKQSQAVEYQEAIACELAIPSSPTTGRDPALVSRCFTDNGLPTPEFVNVP